VRDHRPYIIGLALFAIAASTGSGHAPVAQSSSRPTPSIAATSPATTPTPLLRRAVSTYAGSGIESSTDGPLLSAAFADINYIAADPDRQSFYLTDKNEIRELTKEGAVVTVAGAAGAGSTDGKGSAARFNDPQGIAYDPVDKSLYICDLNNFEIRRMTTVGEVTTVAGSPIEGRLDGTGPEARFSHPVGIAYDSRDGALYVTDNTNNAIRRVTTAGSTTTVAGARVGFGDGAGTNARFKDPTGIAFDAADGALYISDRGNNRIRRVTPEGVVTTYSGDGSFGAATGPAASAQWGVPNGIAWDQVDGSLYVVDTLYNTVRRISAAGIVSNIAGNGSIGSFDGVFEGAEFSFPMGIAVEPVTGYLFVADFGNNLVRLIK
jgi:DNA-binding beta-propeller fold protein YncE